MKSAEIGSLSVCNYNLCMGYLVTIVAKDVHTLILILERHGHAQCLGIQVLPQRRHVNQRCLAGGACVVTRGQQLIEAHFVQQMPAVRNVAWNARRVYIAQADRAMRTRDVLHALQNKTYKR